MIFLENKKRGSPNGEFVSNRFDSSGPAKSTNPANPTTPPAGKPYPIGKSLMTRSAPWPPPASGKPDTHSRSAANVLSAPYTVLDFDGFDGIKPTTPEELQQHLHHSLAIIRWLRDRHHWQLAAILHTGGKSLHAWFQAPPKEILATLKTTAPALGIDPTLIGNPEHPCRLPGMVHQGTGEISRVLWLEIG